MCLPFSTHENILKYFLPVVPGWSINPLHLLMFRFLGTPFFHSMVASSQRFKSNIYAVVHPETILLQDFTSTMNFAYRLDHDWLLFASPRSVSQFQLDFKENGELLSLEDAEQVGTNKVVSYIGFELVQLR